jgi:hypothetical protein
MPEYSGATEAFENAAVMETILKNMRRRHLKTRHGDWLADKFEHDQYLAPWKLRVDQAARATVDVMKRHHIRPEDFQRDSFDASEYILEACGAVVLGKLESDFEWMCAFFRHEYDLTNDDWRQLMSE